MARACAAVSLSRTAWYQPPATDSDKGDDELITALNRTVEKHPRWGFWKCFDYLRLSGKGWNHKRVRDYAEVLSDGRVTQTVTRRALDEMEVDRFGLDEVDRKLLTAIIDKFDGGPVGVGTIAATINEERESIEEIIEPYLIQIGFLNRTPRGRTVTRAAYEHLGVRAPQTERDALAS